MRPEPAFPLAAGSRRGATRIPVTAHLAVGAIRRTQRIACACDGSRDGSPVVESGHVAVSCIARGGPRVSPSGARPVPDTSPDGNFPESQVLLESGELRDSFLRWVMPGRPRHGRTGRRRAPRRRRAAPARPMRGCAPPSAPRPAQPDPPGAPDAPTSPLVAALKTPRVPVLRPALRAVNPPAIAVFAACSVTLPVSRLGSALLGSSTPCRLAPRLRAFGGRLRNRVPGEARIVDRDRRRVGGRRAAKAPPEDPEGV